MRSVAFYDVRQHVSLTAHEDFIRREFRVGFVLTVQRILFSWVSKYVKFLSDARFVCDTCLIGGNMKWAVCGII